MILWFVPEYLGSGDFLRAASRARQPNPDSAAFAAFPFLEVFNRSASVLTIPVYVGGVIAVVFALGDRSKSIALAMAAVSTVLMISVGLMTQAGFAGNLRYIALPAAFVCVLAGAGWVWLVKGDGAKTRAGRGRRARGGDRGGVGAVRDLRHQGARPRRPPGRRRGRPLRHASRTRSRKVAARRR